MCALHSGGVLATNYIVSLAPPGIDTIIAAILQEIASGPMTPAQMALVGSITNTTSQQQFDTLIHSFMPANNATASGPILLSANFNFVENRSAKRREGYFGGLNGISTGDINPDTAFWLGAIGNVASQNLNGGNEGYLMKAVGSIYGVDYRNCNDDIRGIAFSVFNANIYESSNPEFVTRVLSYYGLLYGTNNLRDQKFVEWLFAGAANKYDGSRYIDAGTGNFSVNSSYRGWQAGARFNIGKYIDTNNGLRFSYLATVQYGYLFQGLYNEYGSVAALHVQSNNGNNILTAGGGIRIALPGADPFVTGSREFHAIITYDAINTEQATVASFVVGSPSFSIFNVPERLALQLGADYAITIGDNIQLQFSYNFEARAGFTDNSGMLKLRYLF